MNEQLEERLDRFEHSLSALSAELAELRRLTADSAPVAASLPPHPAAVPRPPAEPPTPARRKPRPTRPAVRVGDLLGARTLAWSGGAVTLLGVVLLFVLAVDRGWIGPWERCAIGFAVSFVLFAGGLWLRQRYGPTHSALAAVGAGIGGAYASLLAAAALYDLLPGFLALVVAAAIASIGLATSIAWSSELVAGLGLVGAMLVPIAVVFDGGLTVLGTSFVAVMLAAGEVVAIRLRWRALLVVAVVASAPQIAVLVGGSAGDASVTALAAIFGLLYLAGAIAEQPRSGPGVDSLPASLAVFAAVFGGWAAAFLFGGAAEGVALLAIGGLYCGLAAAFLARGDRRDLSSLLWAVGIAVGAVALGDLLSGSALAIGWAAEAAVLAWLAVRAREPRFQLGAIAYLGLAAGHALVFDAPLSHLLVAGDDPGAGALGVFAAALAAAIAALHARGWEGDQPVTSGLFRRLDPLFAQLHAAQPALRETFLWLAGGLVAYAASLGLLELFAVAGGHSNGAFDWGHVPVSALWALLAAALLVIGTRRGSRHLIYGGNVVLGIALAKAFVYDLGALSEPAGSYAAFVVGAVVLLGSHLHGRDRAERGVGATSVAGVVGSALLLAIAVTDLVEGRVAGIDADGAALLATASCYGLLAWSVFGRRRDLSTLLWATGLVILLGACPELLSGTLLVVAWAGIGAALAWLGKRTGEHRFHLGAAASVALALVEAVGVEAPLRDLFVSGAHPGAGVPALAAVAVALGALAVCARAVPPQEPPEDAWPWLAYELDRLARGAAPWLAGLVALEAVSLSILQLFQWGGTGSVHLEFQHGHAAVSAFWGVLGLAALYVGLKRHSTYVRLAGFALFGGSLVKIFVYDLSELSSITRALSFLAVGAVLLLGGFLYQRLGSQLDERHAG
jgi:uncharacterized membrane protein